MDSQNSSWLRLGGSHHLPPYNIFCDSPWGLHPNGVFPRTPKLGISQFLKLGFLPLWTPIASCADLWLKWSLKQGYSLHWDLCNDMWHGSCTQINQGNFELLVVGNQIDTLTLSPSFDHNLCCKYSSGSCEPILDIYVIQNFQWYNEVLNPMSFDFFNCFLNISTPKVGIHLGVCGFIPSHFPTFLGVWIWLTGYTLNPHLPVPLPWSWA
jgi:hypothetical protein